MKSKHFIPIVLVLIFTGMLSVKAQQTAEQLYQSGLYKEEIEGQLDAAIEIYQKIVSQYPENRSVMAKTYLHIGLCREKLGNAEAQKAYEHVISDYSDQVEAMKLAKERLGALSASGGGPSGSDNIVMHRIWEAGRNSPCGVSPDGQYVVFISSVTNDLWLRNLQSGEKSQITHEGSIVDWTFATDNASISPNGKLIAYDWWIRYFREIRLSDLNGSSMRVLHSGQNDKDMWIYTWMPDSYRLLAGSYDQKDQYYRLHIISLPEGNITDFGQPDSKYIDHVWPSPDGRYIGYSRHGDIYIYDTKTEQESELFQNNATDALSGWVPDGSGIVFVSDRSGTYDLYLQGIENGKTKGNIQLLRKDFGSNPGICLNRDGKLFRADNTGSQNSFITEVDKQTGKLKSTYEQVDPNYPMVEYPGWSKDGRLLYYQIYKGPSNETYPVLLIHSEEKSQTREIITKPKLPGWYQPVLSPDNLIYAVTGGDGVHNFGVFAINADNGDVNQLVKIPESPNPVTPCQNWSPDGKAIYYKIVSSEKSEEFIIRRKDLTTGEEKEIYRGFHTREMKISSDGSRFAYFRHDMPDKSYMVGIMDIQSGKELRSWPIPEKEAPGGIWGVSWTPDGKYILVDRSLIKGSELWRYPVEGGQGEKLHFFPYESYGFEMHPDGNRIAFTQNKTNYELWVMENFLPK